MGSLTLTPRQAYPLYYALGNLFVWLHPGEPARAVNLASAVYGALAVGVAARLASSLADSVLAGLGAGLFLAFSYTFWSQAITAEVYTLHLLLVGAALLALLSWAKRPSQWRLAVFYAIYALGFGNHLSMVLLLPALAVFLLLHRQRGAADPLRPQMIAMAMGIAAFGALQYAWNFRGLWAELEPPASLLEAVGKFWYDVTKADWRDTLVMSVSESGLENRPAMYWFDLRQQFGVPGVLLAAVGMAYAMFRWPRRGLLLALVYLANLAFAWTYNVGDVYIFFLPAHYVVALWAGAGVAAIVAVASRISSRAVAIVAGALCLLYPAWRGYDTLPALDRSWDNRAAELLDQFTTIPRDAIYAVDMNWQAQNAFDYFIKERKPGTPWFTTADLEWLEQEDVTARFQKLLDANLEMDRAVVVSTGAYKNLVSRGYSGAVGGPARDRFVERVLSAPMGTPYALAILRPDPEYPLDMLAIGRAWAWLAADAASLPELRSYTILAGRVGTAPDLIKSENHPYRIRQRVEPFELDIRMESWLPTDTIRRSGFGHVIVGRTHMLTLERGVSFIALGRDGGPAYHSGLFAPIPRYVLGVPGEQ